MSKVHSAIEKLDIVFQYLYSNEFKNIVDTSPKYSHIKDAVFHFELGDPWLMFATGSNLANGYKIVDSLHEFKDILAKLIDDGNLKLNNDFYELTFAGRYFLETEHCYRDQARKRDSDAQKQNQINLLLMRGSWVAGFGAVGLCLIEVLKLYLNTGSYKMLLYSAIALFLSGACCGAILWYILPSAKE